jgi:hypothetical protein
MENGACEMQRKLVPMDQIKLYTHADTWSVLPVVQGGISLCEAILYDTLLTERLTHRLRLLWGSHLAVDNAATSAMIGTL